MKKKYRSHAMFDLRVLMVKYRKVRRTIVLYESGVAEKYVRAVQDMYEDSESVGEVSVRTDEVRQMSQWTI